MSQSTVQGSPAALAETLDYASLIRDDRVSSRLYTDAQVFRDEIERIWSRTWVYVGHDSEVPEPGDYVTRRIGNQPVIMVRSNDGDVRTLYNRCPHRGNTVCQYDTGNTTAFRCAYHGWTFKTDGRNNSVTIPSGYGEDFDRRRFDMTPVETGTYRGFVFGRLTPGGPSLEEHLGPYAARYLDAFTDHAPAGTIRVGAAGTLKVRYKANWKMALENACDAYHVMFVHRAALDIFKNPNMSLNKAYGENSHFRTVDIGGGHGMMDFSRHNRATGMTAVFLTAGSVSEEVTRRYKEALAERLGPERTEDLLGAGLGNVAIFPNLMLVGGDIRVVHPLGPEESIVDETPAMLDGAPEEINQSRVRRAHVNYAPTGMIGPDDLEVYERNQQGFHATGNEWVLLARGLHREVVDAPGMVSGDASDEVAQRAFYHRYRTLMTAGEVAQA